MVSPEKTIKENKIKRDNIQFLLHGPILCIQPKEVFFSRVVAFKVVNQEIIA